MEKKRPGNMMLAKLANQKKGAETRSELAKQRSEAIEEAEGELYQQSLELLRDASMFGQMDPEVASTPREWIQRYGQEEAAKRHRIAKAAWLPAKDAPSGLNVAKYVVGAFAKSRADAKRPKTLNVQLIQIAAPPRAFPELEVVEDRDK